MKKKQWYQAHQLSSYALYKAEFVPINKNRQAPRHNIMISFDLSTETPLEFFI